MSGTYNKERDIAFDWARIIASIMVVFLHVDAAWKYQQWESEGVYESFLFDSICRSAVPLFFMISGAFYKDKELIYTLKKIFKYSTVFVCAIFTYWISDEIWNYMLGTGIENKSLIDILCNYKYHLWFMPAYICTLTIAPIVVKAMIGDVNYSLTKYLLAIWFGFEIVGNTVAICIIDKDRNAELIHLVGLIQNLVYCHISYTGYFILGRFLYQNDVKIKKTISILGIIISSITIFALNIYYASELGKSDDRWANTLSLFGCIQATSWFLFFKEINTKNRYSAIREYICKCSFGIYIVHVLFLDWAYRLGVFDDGMLFGVEVVPVINIPIRVCIIYLLSFILVYLSKKNLVMVKKIIYTWK